MYFHYVRLLQHLKVMKSFQEISRVNLEKKKVQQSLTIEIQTVSETVDLRSEIVPQITQDFNNIH
jgi:hypothetical protein